MIKLNVGACRKVSDNHYGSKGGNVNIELELDSSLALDSQKLRDHIRKLFDLANASLEEELQGTTEPASVEDSRYQLNESTECKVASFNELTVQQASRMIETLKVSGVN
jgi:hypothetical protein